MRVRPNSLIVGNTRNGRFTPSVIRYLISSNSPSGGTKLTVFSELNRVKFTHWWKVTSSSSIVFPLLLGRALSCDSFSRPILSFKPNFRSGIPERKHFMRIFPVTSQRKTLPTKDMRRLTLSTISRNTCQHLYTRPSLLQPTAPVTCNVALGTGLSTACSENGDRTPSCVM
nr:hypothetical protein PoMZ_10739 [Ipomoea batatas]